MTKKEFDSLTEEQRYELLQRIEEEKDFTDKALNEFLTKNNESKNKERFIILTEVGHNLNSLLIKVENIMYARENCEGITEINVKDFPKKGDISIIQVYEDPYTIYNKIYEK